MTRPLNKSVEISILEEKNPLQITSKQQIAQVKNTNRSINRSGRPTTKNEIKFSPQPKSIIAQMLCEMKKDVAFDNDSSSDSVNNLSDLGETVNLKEEELNRLSSSNSQELETDQDKTAPRQFTCDYPNCTYSCKLSSNLIKHKRVHTNEKPYLCDRCCFRTNFVNSLKAHKRIHTSDRPFQCEYCTYKCNTSSNLKKHCRHRHSRPKQDII